MFWQRVTYFGDSMLLLPAAVIITLALMVKSSRRCVVWYWLLTFGLAGLTVALSKMLFLGYGIGSSRFNFTGFSGHSAMSATLWPIMLWLLSGQGSRWGRLILISSGYVLAIVVSVSRLVLQAHSFSEVITGLLLGSLCSGLFLLSQRQTRCKGFTLPQILLVLLLPLLLLLYGHAATTQQFLESLAAHIAGLEKPWTRADLLK